MFASTSFKRSGISRKDFPKLTGLIVTLAPGKLCKGLQMLLSCLGNNMEQNLVSFLKNSVQLRHNSQLTRKDWHPTRYKTLTIFTKRLYHRCRKYASQTSFVQYLLSFLTNYLLSFYLFNKCRKQYGKQYGTVSVFKTSVQLRRSCQLTRKTWHPTRYRTLTTFAKMLYYRSPNHTSQTTFFDTFWAK